MNPDNLLRLIINIILAELRLYISEEENGYVYFTYPTYNSKTKAACENIYMVSYDEEDAFNFLDLDYKQFLTGIDPTFEAIAAYLATSPYMNFSSLDIIYHKHLKIHEEKKWYLKTKKLLETKYKASFDFPSYDNFYLHLANKYFAADITGMVDADNRDAIIYPDRYNAKLLMNYTGLKEGKELGTTKQKFIEYIEALYGESFNSFLYRHTEEKVKEIFKKYFSIKHTA